MCLAGSEGSHWWNRARRDGEPGDQPQCQEPQLEPNRSCLETGEDVRTYLAEMPGRDVAKVAGDVDLVADRRGYSRCWGCARQRLAGIPVSWNALCQAHLFVLQVCPSVVCAT